MKVSTLFKIFIVVFVGGFVLNAINTGLNLLRFIIDYWPAIIIIAIIGFAYYFLYYKPKQRNKEINK